MLTLSRKRKLKKWLYSRYSLFFLLVLIVLMFTPVFNMYKSYSESKRSLLVLEDSMENILSQKLLLEEDIDYLKSDLGRESEIRRRFGTGKEGELMAFVIESESKKIVEKKEEEKNSWEKLKNWLKEIF
jgi:hypothetical protein